MGHPSAGNSSTNKDLILVVEDDYLIREQLKEALPEFGFSVYSVANAEEAQGFLNQSTPDVILCDIRLPGMWGTDFKRLIEKDERLSSIPFVFLSALSGISHIREGMDAAADDYVTKPFRLTHLAQVLQLRIAKSNRRSHQTDQLMEELVESLQLIFPHELVTPLSVIYGMSEYLKELEEDGASDTATRIEMLEAINQSVLRMRKLVDRFGVAVSTKVGSVERHELRVGEDPVYELAALLHRTLDVIIEESNPNQRIERDLKSGECRVPPQILERIIIEVVNNALKFSPSESTIRICGEREKDFYILDVSDEGPGMTRDQISKIGSFRQFFRTKREQQGAGLGLAITKRLVAMIGSEVLFLPSTPTGLTVRLKLPIPSEKG